MDWQKTDTILMQPKSSSFNVFNFNQRDIDQNNYEDSLILTRSGHGEQEHQNQNVDDDTDPDPSLCGGRGPTHNDKEIRDLIPLKNLEHISLQQEVQLTQIFFGCDRKIIYKIRAENCDQEFWRGTEETDFFSRFCLGPMRPFDIVIRDEADRSVINLSRECQCATCCCCCYGRHAHPCSTCLQSMDVFEGQRPAILLGRVEQLPPTTTGCQPQLQILSGEGETMLKIRGPPCPTFFSFCRFHGDVDFDIFFMDDDVVGKISKKWNGLCSSTAGAGAGGVRNCFEITFPKDLDVKLKATLLGACVLIDFMYF